jgi:hypothetical protein
MVGWLTSSSNVNSAVGLIFIPHNISPEAVPSLWGVRPTWGQDQRLVAGAGKHRSVSIK